MNFRTDSRFFVFTKPVSAGEVCVGARKYPNRQINHVDSISAIGFKIKHCYANLIAMPLPPAPARFDTCK